MKILLTVVFGCITLAGFAQNIFPASGNVGLGTTSPGVQLHVKGDGWIAVEKTGVAETGIQFKKNGAVLFYMYSDNLDNDALKIQSTAFASTGENDATPRIQIPYDNKNLYLVQSGGNVGIGTSSPQQALDVRGSLVLENGSHAVLYTGTGTTELNRYLQLLNSPSSASASGLKAGGVLVADTYSYAHPGKNDLIVKGNVGIGTSSPNQKLTVNGTIYGKEVKVDLSVPGPDYVFEKNYNLPSLESVQSFINQNKHLPEVPSAKEMEANGINLSEMNMLLLKKVEELTLYMVEQQVKMSKMQSEINDLKERK